MIRKEWLTEIGTFYKPHGIKGEISAGFDYDLSPDGLRSVIVAVDGIFVPFFIESWRMRGQGRYLIKLEGVDNETDASAFVNQPIFAIASDLPEPEEEDDDDDGVYLYDLIGYKVEDDGSLIGEITAVDDSTDNILLHIRRPEGNLVYVPFTEDWIEELDTDTKTLSMSLPEGILTLNS